MPYLKEGEQDDDDDDEGAAQKPDGAFVLSRSVLLLVTVKFAHCYASFTWRSSPLLRAG